MENPMGNSETLSQVIGIIRPYVKNAAALETAGDETRILQDLGVNSARLVDIILDFEDRFKISIDDASADKVRTIGDAVGLVSRLTH